MSEHLMKKAIDAAKRAFQKNEDSFTFCGITFSIRHAHHNQYQVLLPGDVEFVRLVSGKNIQVLMV